jgi:hypothetical protein
MLEENNIYFRQATANEHAMQLRIQFPIYRAATAKTQVVMLVLLGTHGVESIEINSQGGLLPIGEPEDKVDNNGH